MKVEIEIPDFVPPERIIHILAGANERIGWIEPHTRKVHTKISQCNRCGKCCQRINCEHLTNREGCGFLCNHPGSITVLCATSEPKNIESCTSRYN